MKLRRLLCVLLALSLLSCACLPASAAEGAFRLIAPEDWELPVGMSRTLDYAFSADVSDRALSWSSSAPAVASVDAWGRVTGLAAGEAVIAAETSGGLRAQATVRVAAAESSGAPHAAVVDYAGTPASEGESLQKLVTRYPSGDSGIPQEIQSVISSGDYTKYKTAQTADGAQWAVTGYGVLRTDSAAADARDREMRFMGDRYFYELDTSGGKVLGILPDGENGVWTVMASGVTHIAMTAMTGSEKAERMSADTQQYVSRRGMVAEARWDGTAWLPQETDNDGLWTAMYAAGELFRYASLRRELAAAPQDADLAARVAAAKKTAYLSTEAVLLLANISMRGGTVEALVRYQQEGKQQNKYLSPKALLEGGDPSVKMPDFSPSLITSSFKDKWLKPFSSASWADTEKKPDLAYAHQTRSLSGFVARTYSVESEPGYHAPDGSVYFSFASYSAAHPTAQGLSTNRAVNSESMAVEVDASGAIPQRLYDDLLTANGVDLTRVVYKGDTSTDELIGHFFLYKIAYDVLGGEDPEIGGIIADTMDGIAQHLSDNSYRLTDATGQPTTWGKMGRDYFYSYRWGAPSSPLTASVLLCAFKTAAYVTGAQRWEDEYRMLLQDSAYRYGEVAATHSARDMEFLDGYAGMIPGGRNYVANLGEAELSFILRSFAQYSDEEMAMLAFYILFQTEEDPDTLTVYRGALDQWWEESLRFSENPLWYYIYQLSRPAETGLTDAYGNSLLQTAAWSLSRHPVDTRRWCASSSSRDDLMMFNMEDYAGLFETRGGLSIRKTTLPSTRLGLVRMISYLGKGGIEAGGITYAVPAPDERALHKYNNATYILGSDGSRDYDPNMMEGSTTYTLPYWMGVYHGMLRMR